jgi:hypothetical protein
MGVIQTTRYLHTGGQTLPQPASTLDAMSETTIIISLDDRLVETVDVLASLTEESRTEIAARLVAAGVAHKGFMIPADVPC